MLALSYSGRAWSFVSFESMAASPLLPAPMHTINLSHVIQLVKPIAPSSWCLWWTALKFVVVHGSRPEPTSFKCNDKHIWRRRSRVYSRVTQDAMGSSIISAVFLGLHTSPITISEQIIGAPPSHAALGVGHIASQRRLGSGIPTMLPLPGGGSFGNDSLSQRHYICGAWRCTTWKFQGITRSKTYRCWNNITRVDANERLLSLLAEQ